MDKQWRPKVKDYTFFTKTEDGVFFKAWSDEFVLKGQNLIEWIKRIYPFLDGTKTVEELVAPLPEQVAAFVTTLLQQLADRGILEDGTLAGAELPAGVRWPQDKQTILLLKEKASDWPERLQKVKGASLLLLGTGSSPSAFLQSMIRFGLQRFYLLKQQSQEMQQQVIAWQKEHSSLSVQWWEPEEINAYLAEQQNRPDLIVYVNDVRDVSAEQTALQWAAQHHLPVLMATGASGRGLVGSVLSTANQEIWTDVIERLHPQPKVGGDTDDLFFRMLGNFTAVKVFQHISGLSADAPNEVTLLEADTLTSSRHRLLPVANGETSRAAALELFRAKKQGISRAEFLKNLETFADDKFGLLSSLHPRALPQIPLIHMQAVVHLPNRYAKEPLVCIGAGESIEEASEAAIRTAFMSYAQQMESADASQAEAEEAFVGSWSCGRSYPEWYGNGLLQSCFQWITQKHAPVSLRRLPPTGCHSEKCNTLLHLLQSRYRREVVLYELQTDWPSVHIIRLELDGRNAFAGAGKTQAEAVYAVLSQAVSAVQLQQESLFPLGQSGVVEEMPAAWVENEPQADDWSLWNLKVTEHLIRQGYSIVELPWLREQSFDTVGLLVGRIAIAKGGRAN